MNKTIILKNQTPSNIELLSIGETLLASGQLEVSEYTAVALRNDSTLTVGIDSGDIVINDGTKDLDDEIGIEFVRNDIANDIDGFWYAKRRRFSVLWSQLSHGFVPGQIVRLDEDTGIAVLALADTHANSATSSIVAELVDADSFYAGLSGAVVQSVDATAVEGGLPLTVGAAYFLSTTVPGQLTPNVPQGAGEIIKLVGIASGTSALVSFTYAGYENETALSTVEVNKIKSGGGFIPRQTAFHRPIVSMTVNDPSTLSPTNGSRYVVGTSPVGVWAGEANNVTEYVSSTSSWVFNPPETGSLVFNNATDKLNWFNGTVWAEIVPPCKVCDLPGPPAGQGAEYSIQLKWGPIDRLIGTSSIPKDATIPLIAEGTEIWNDVISLQDIESRIRIATNITFSSSNASIELIFAVFRNDVCIGTAVNSTANKSSGFSISLELYDIPAAGSPQDLGGSPPLTYTYSCRVGKTGSGTWYINEIHKNSQIVHFSGTLASNSYTIEELGVVV